MKWNDITKGKAIEMIKAGIGDEEISKVVGMSTASVRLLKYTEVNTNNERVQCAICKRTFKQITVKHLNDHGISLDEYKEKYPDAKTITDCRMEKYQTFKHPNKGKTYEEIYGAEEAAIKKEKISEKQIGREAPQMAGTGITGTRKDTGMFARSSYEANMDRIFAFENKKVYGEFSEQNSRFTLIRKDGTEITYQPDRIDADGLFCRGAYLEIKGYMHPEDWEKICLFREQNTDKKLMIISKDEKYRDINYEELEAKYKGKIPLWEDEYQNYRNNPEIYKTDYIEPEIVKFYREKYSPLGISNSIKDEHMRFVAEKCVSFCSVRLGDKTYIDEVKLIAITDRRPQARISTGKYNYELWEALAHDGRKYYVTNQWKTTTFYCYEEKELSSLSLFFENNNNLLLKFGQKKETVFCHIDDEIVESFERKDILKRIEDIFSHDAIPHTVKGIELVRREDTKRGALNDREEWKITTEKERWEYRLSNFGNATNEYKLIEICNE